MSYDVLRGTSRHGSNARLRRMRWPWRAPVFPSRGPVCSSECLARARLHGRMSSNRPVRILGQLGHASTASVAEQNFFSTLQQGVGLGHISHVARYAYYGMNQTGGRLYTNMAFHPEMLVVALLRLVHLPLTRAFLIFRE